MLFDKMLNGRSTFVLTLENNIYLEEISGVIKEICVYATIAQANL